jgi:uncharacterized RDD family membrane protein YckC
MFCPACGAETATDDRFCQRCGKPLHASPAETATPPTAVRGLDEVDETPRGDSWSPRFEPYPTPPPGVTPFPGTAGSQRPPWEGSAEVMGAPLAPFGAPLAGWWQRVGAALLDSLIAGIPLGIVLAVINAAFGTRTVVVTNGVSHTIRSVQGPGHWVLIVAIALLAGAYMAYFNGTGDGQTPGNRAPGIAVRDVETGAAIGLGRGAIRWLVRAMLYACFVIPGLLNDLFPLWDRRRQTLADKAARSVVIRIR